MWVHLEDANKKIRELMIEYVDNSHNHETGGICRYMQDEFSDQSLDSYAIIEALGVIGYLDSSRPGVNPTRLNFANCVIDNITHPGIKILVFKSGPNREDEGPYKVLASSKVLGAKQARERIVRFARRNSSW